MKNKLIITSMLLLGLQTNECHATNLNRVFIDTGVYKMGQAHPHLFNEKLIFSGELNNEARIWALDTETLDKQILFEGFANNNNNKKYFQKFMGAAFFSGTDESSYSKSIWKTDGSPAGTVQVFDTEISGGLYVNNGFLFAKTSDYKLLVTDGIDTVVHDVDVRNMNSTCVLDIDNVVVQSDSQQTTPYQPFKHSHNGVVTTLDITINLPVEVYLPQITQHDDACLIIGIDGADDSDQLWKIDAGGELASLNDVINNERVIQLLSHQNKLYALTFGPYSGAVQRFSQDLTTIDAVFGDPNSQDLSANKMRSVGEYLAVSMRTPTISPAQPFIAFTDSDLVQVQGANIRFEDLPTSYESMDDLVLKFSGNNPYLLLNPFTQVPVKLNINSAYSDVIADEEGSQIFIKTRDDSGHYQLSQIKDKPDIDLIATGGWYDTSVHNQGLNIRKGTRHNGSEYVSVTGYTYRDGMPLWFAGDAELNIPATKLNVELYEFSGIGLFEAENRPDLEFFGDLELEMISCHQMTANITTSNQMFTLNMHRLDDVTFTQNCVD